MLFATPGGGHAEQTRRRRRLLLFAMRGDGKAKIKAGFQTTALKKRVVFRKPFPDPTNALCERDPDNAYMSNNSETMPSSNAPNQMLRVKLSNTDVMDAAAFKRVAACAAETGGNAQRIFRFGSGFEKRIHSGVRAAALCSENKTCGFFQKVF